jgi:WD40 repeat protein
MLLLRGHTSNVRSLAFSPDGTLLASGSDDTSVRLWDARTGEAVRVQEDHTRTVQVVTFTPNGRRLFSCGDDSRLVGRNPSRAEEMFTFLGGAFDQCVALAVSPDGGLLAVGSDRSPYGSRTSPLRIIDLNTERELPPLFPVDRNRPVWSLAFAPRERTLAIAFNNGDVVLWDFVRNREATRLPHTIAVRAMAFSPDGVTLVTSPATPALVWDLPTRTVRHRFGEIRHAIESLAFVPDNVTLATGCLDSTVRLWDTRTGLEKARFDWKLGRVHAVAIAPDGMTAAAGGENGDIIIWDVDL